MQHFCCSSKDNTGYFPLLKKSSCALLLLEVNTLTRKQNKHLDLEAFSLVKAKYSVGKTFLKLKSFTRLSDSDCSLPVSIGGSN